jgi:hypothetical protein
MITVKFVKRHGGTFYWDDPTLAPRWQNFINNIKGKIGDNIQVVNSGNEVHFTFNTNPELLQEAVKADIDTLDDIVSYSTSNGIIIDSPF